MEIWKDIKGFEGKYQISNKGRVKSLTRKINNQYCKRDYILKTYRNQDGYIIVYLSKHHKNICYRIHRLVAIYFIDNPENKPEVNHKDGNPSNNELSNLEWVTHKENIKHAVNTGLFNIKGENHSRHKLKEHNVRMIRFLYSTGYWKLKDLSRIYNITIEGIRLIIIKYTWKHI